MERYNSKRGWFVNAWRIVDENGKDMVQPWPNTKGEDIREIERLRMEQNLRKNTLIREYRKQSNLYAWLVSRLSMADLDILRRRPLGSKEEVEEVLAEIKKICN